MAIYADKRDGKLTGRWRVELTKGTERYRKRHETMKDAEEDEKRVLAAWEAGETAKDAAPLPRKAASGCLTFGEGIKEAEGILWEQADTKDIAWSRLRSCVEFLGHDRPLDDLKTTDLDRLRLHLKKEGRTDATVNRFLSCLRTFLTWCKARDFRTLPVNKDTIVFPWIKEKSGRLRWITYEEEARLLSLMPDNVAKLVRVALDTGCRRDELLTARLDQLSATHLHLWDTKTEEPRHVPLRPETAAILKELIETKTMPTRRNLRSWWDRAKDRMGLADDNEFVFHTCRHTRAVRLVDAGIDVLLIKELLGHKRIETTLRYAKVRPQNLERVVERVGEIDRVEREKAQKSAVPHVPPGLPQGGEIVHLAA